MYDMDTSKYPWVVWAFSILPSMVSFSLGGLAIFLALSNGLFLSFVREGGDRESFLISVTVAFFHFILVQFLALGMCFLVIAYPTPWMSGVAFWLFVYAMACGIAAAATLVDVGEIINALGVFDEDGSPDEEE